MRGVPGRPSLLAGLGLVAGLALIADVSGHRVADAYTLDVTLPGWPLAAFVVALGAGSLWRWRARRRSRPVSNGVASSAADAVASSDVAASPAVAAPSVAVASPAALATSADARVPDRDGMAPRPVEAVQRIAVRSTRSITLVAVDEITHIEAEGRYARIHAAGREYLAQYSLGELERMLDASRFVRVHRSAIVSLPRIRSLRTSDYRDFELLLDNDATVRLSRNYRARLEAALGQRI